MNAMDMDGTRIARRARVIALHCSGAGARQWRRLTEALGGGWDVQSPEHYGSESGGSWRGDHPFRLADEAARTLALIDQRPGKVHLVGHSYGGGVALRVALERADRIASLALYEPSAFHLLTLMGTEGATAFAEIAALAREVGDRVVCGDYRSAMAAFVDYWNGPGSWQSAQPAARDALQAWAPKAPLDFHALMAEQTPLSAYRALRMPALLMRGQRSPGPSRLIVERLAQALPQAQLVEIGGAGHMGPFSHAENVTALIAQHVDSASQAMLPRPLCQPRPERRPPQAAVRAPHKHRSGAVAGAELRPQAGCSD